MHTQILNEKMELIQWLSSIEDQSIIKKLMEFRKEETKDWGEKFQIWKNILLKGE